MVSMIVNMIGQNYRFGYRAAGDATDLVQLCKEYGIGAYIINPVMHKNHFHLFFNFSSLCEDALRNYKFDSVKGFLFDWLLGSGCQLVGQPDFEFFNTKRLPLNWWMQKFVSRFCG
ncbi:unnamed protein product [Fraxinus pennsylvanica]|uniref:FAD synthase n=1 Tax=Fraxinus pennsylvanica TaxID=56036 RepID=A0AAD2AC37_9LAMI|nr:unnamed protein product [Fraxinus pennsylvanica]